jgi:hypothetical protein
VIANEVVVVVLVGDVAGVVAVVVGVVLGVVAVVVPVVVVETAASAAPTFPTGTLSEPWMPIPLSGLSSSSGKWCVVPALST